MGTHAPNREVMIFKIGVTNTREILPCVYDDLTHLCVCVCVGVRVRVRVCV